MAKVHRNEEVAIHIGPEPCADTLAAADPRVVVVQVWGLGHGVRFGGIAGVSGCTKDRVAESAGGGDQTGVEAHQNQ